MNLRFELDSFRLLITGEFSYFYESSDNSVSLDIGHYSNGISFVLEDGLIKHGDRFLIFQDGLKLSTYSDGAVSLKLYSVEPDIYYLAFDGMYIILNESVSSLTHQCESAAMLQILMTGNFHNDSILIYQNHVHDEYYLSVDGVDLFRDDLTFGLTVIGEGGHASLREFNSDNELVYIGAEDFTLGYTLNFKKFGNEVYILTGQDMFYMEIFCDDDYEGFSNPVSTVPKNYYILVPCGKSMFKIKRSTDNDYLYIDFVKLSFGMFGVGDESTATIFQFAVMY
ncbi:hypothetical protein AYI69_g8278 [Smittium culicis]|uniref:Uncharacterized protein n=1 Tax=Smittium culicis TaxID=133412 RepID=A0A1R1XKQ6_9FUNG|nr:hypothetical protein AYI69_g8278 [Smittium culicis]